MKAVTQAVRDTLMQDMAVSVQPRLIAEWEYNRFFIPTVTVTPDQTTTDLDWQRTYDLNSIVLPFRPTAGIAFARADNGVTPLSGPYRDPGTTRFYPTPDVPLYSYFASIQRSQLTQASDGYEFDAPIKVSVVYPNPIAVNKIVVGFETGYAAPKSFSIQVSPDGVSWNTIYSNGTLDPDGSLTIWHSDVVGSGWGGTGWDVNAAYDSPVTIQGVRAVVYSMDQPYAHADVLQISPRLENDLSPYLITYDVQMSQDSPSFIAPLGKASSNTASLTLSNIDGRFNNENASSLYHGMIEKKVRFTLDLGIDASKHGGQKYEYAREFTMWADTWGASDNSTIQVDLKDSSVLLQEQTMPSVFLTNATVGQIIWQTLDTIGMTNYQYTRNDPDYGTVIPYYWPSDEAESSNPRWGRLMVNTKTPPTTTIWDELSALVESTQTALYFDEHDVLQIKAREQMYNTGKLPDWNLDAVKNGSKMPDVVSTQTDYSLTTNQVELTYKPCAMADDQNGFPKMEVVWQPTAPTSTSIVPNANASSTVSDTTITLRASALSKDLLNNGTDLWIHQPDAIFWPFETDVNIEGEMLHYKGKEYGYYDADGNLQTAICQSQDDANTYNALNESLSWKNAYTGRLIVTDRGLYGSGTGDHYIQSSSYEDVAIVMDNSAYYSLGTGWTQFNDGYVTLKTPITDGNHPHEETWRLRRHKNSVMPQNGSNTVWYGTKIRYPGAGSHLPDATSGSGWHIGGIHFGGDGGTAGYYLELTPTTQIDGWEQRRFRNELCLFGKARAGGYVQFSGTNAADPQGGNDANGNPLTTGNLGFKAAVLEDTWYQIDVCLTEGATSNVTVYLNGVFAGSWVISSSQRPQFTNNGRFGTFVRGPSAGMDVDYLYAIGQDDTNPFNDPDQTSFLDILSGGFASSFLRKNVLYACGNVLAQWPSGVPSYGDPLNGSNLVFDEFGPVVHEVRTFDVQFDSQFIPVASSYLYLTNPQAECLSYYADASGAHFTIANASRDNIILNGADQLPDPSGGSSSTTINYTLSIYGRVVYTAQNDSIKIVRDEAAVRRQGLVRTQFTTRYIQTDLMAGVIGDWILSLWASGIDQVSAELFGNPLLQIGDLVTVNFPSKGMAPSTHQYFITSIKGSFSKGYKTSITMRRARV